MLSLIYTNVTPQIFSYWNKYTVCQLFWNLWRTRMRIYTYGNVDSSILVHATCVCVFTCTVWCCLVFISLWFLVYDCMYMYMYITLVYGRGFHNKTSVTKNYLSKICLGSMENASEHVTCAVIVRSCTCT